MVCPTCQQVNPRGARFCNNCGAVLEESAPITGDRRLVTILFADVVGSTAWAERVDPEEWAEIMNTGLRLMIPAVTRYEGTVARLMGDGLLALFGAPVAHEDDAERAVLAGLAIRAAAAEYAKELEPRYGTEFSVRVGINTGLSVLTRVGDETMAEYTAMGDAANLAARLQGLAPPQGIVIGPETYRLVRHAFEVRSRGSEAIRGRSESVEAYEVIAPLTAGTARGRGSLATPFVGREEELATIQAAVLRANAGQPGLAFVVGEAGLGKSRLLSELRSREPDVAWLEGRAISYARTAPYHPLRQPLIDSLRAPPDASNEELAAAVRELHGVHVEGSAGSGTETALKALLGLGNEEPERAEPFEARDAARYIAAGVRAHLARLARDRTLVLVLEDIHWADHATTDLIENLAFQLSSERLLLICAMRPDLESRAWQLLETARARTPAEPGLQVEVVQVQALQRGHAEELLRDLLGMGGLPSAVRKLVLEKSEGNPFYIEEVVHGLVEAGHIVREDGRWTTTGPITDLALPGTLAGVLGARIDRLPDRERQVAQTASVIGREFATPLLRAVMREPPAAPPDLNRPLGSLTLEGLLSQVDVARFADYRFKHEFTRDAAYQRLLMKRRRELHARIGEEMEALFGSHREIAKDLAHHYSLGEQWLKAARWSLEAARSARRLYEPADAFELTEAALDALARLEGARSPDAIALHAEVLNELVSLGMQMRQHEQPESRPLLQERGQLAVDLSRQVGDKRALVQSLVNLGNVHVLSGFPRTGFQWLMEAYDLASELGDERLFLLPLWVATEIMLDDAPAVAVEQLDDVIDMARRVGNVHIEAHALGTKTAALARLGEFDAALRLGPRALAAAESSNSVIKLADVNLLFGMALLEMGRLRPGIQHLTRGTELALSVNGFECACNGLHLMGVGHLEEAEIEEAVADLARAMEAASGTAMEGVLHNVRAALASAHFMGGDVTALESIEREVGNAEALSDGFGAARARLALGEALVALGKGEQAVPNLQSALEWVDARRMLPYSLKGYRLLAAALREVGDEQGSAAAAHKAVEVRGSIHWPPQAPDAAWPLSARAAGSSGSVGPSGTGAA